MSSRWRVNISSKTGYESLLLLAATCVFQFSVKELRFWCMLSLSSGAPFPPCFREVVKTIFKRMFRVYAHIYHSHFQKIVHLKEEAHLNTCFKHFILFSRVRSFMVHKLNLYFFHGNPSFSDASVICSSSPLGVLCSTCMVSPPSHLICLSFPRWKMNCRIYSYVGKYLWL